MRVLTYARHGMKALVAIVAGAAVAVTAFSVAQAAPPYATEATLSSVSFVEDTIESGERAEIAGAWSLPDNPATPAGFTVDLPDGLSGLSDEFDLLDPDGVVMGHCDVTATQIVCDVDADYIAEHPRNLRGTFTFWAEVETEVTETRDITYDFGDAEATVTVTPPVNDCPGCTFEGKDGGKWGKYDNATNSIQWGVEIPSPKQGMAAGQEVTVLERLGAGQTWQIVDGHPDIYVVGTNVVDAEGFPTGWHRVDDRVGTTVTATPEGALVEFTAEEGWFYSVHGRADTTDAGASGTYRNEADITVAGVTTKTVSASVTRQGGGGTGSGDTVGRFSAMKVIAGTGASLVPADATLTLSYEYPAGTGFAAGSGTLTLPADGTEVVSPELPVGAQLTLAEVAPLTIDGADWGEPQLSTSTVTIARGEVVEVTVINTLTTRPDATPSPTPTATPTPTPTATPTATPTPTPTATTAPTASPSPSQGVDSEFVTQTPTPVAKPGGSLAVTGGQTPTGLLLAGAVLVALGLGLVARRRRATRD